MSCITIGQTAILKIEHAYEERDKHIGLVTIGKRLVQRRHDTMGLSHMSRDITEQRSRHSHHQRGWHALS